MDLEETVHSNDFILMEAAVIETLRRDSRISLHPRLEHAALIYNKSDKTILSQIYCDFIDVSQESKTPICICTPTWRTNYERIKETKTVKDINRDTVYFLQSLREDIPNNGSDIFIGGLIGCKNDCYKPEEALSLNEAKDFHSWQISKLADAGVDYLLAATLPCLSEAEGIALAMKTTGTPYIISFVIDSTGLILDGTNLDKAFTEIDALTNDAPPLGYMINCSYPSSLRPQNQTEYVLKRLIGFQANASSKDHSELDNNKALQINNINEWGEQMLALNKQYGIKILGGCCGTNVKHLEYIVKGIKIN
ncbi:MAG: homocysteine S-methyltransferase family protein [Candidatus Anammoxibacter sp.]